ncbi:hypothetical protein C8D88_116112 [Lentzea atacamensis]|uniref:Uncharacterized protein n=1 Tax=Lentzea atacamensis TaxID=531938 RepID=A0A316HKE7_9PSEU|nr:hypothetical protein [Lentzea atacamensis]PWK81701.1 hypothetical protein C8D88_116112 [Lentzea atacamensis]
MSGQDDVAPAAQASGGRSARCGHVTEGCPRCGRNDPLLGSSIGDDQYCHTFSEGYPTCYMLTQWERPRDELHADPFTSGLAEIFDRMKQPPAVGP